MILYYSATHQCFLVQRHLEYDTEYDRRLTNIVSTLPVKEVVECSCRGENLKCLYCTGEGIIAKGSVGHMVDILTRGRR